MTNIHLPENIGDTPDKLGQKSKNESYSVSLAIDKSVRTFKTQVLTQSSEIIPEPTSDNALDIFGLQRKISTYLLFRSTSRYDIEQTQWDFTTADSSSVAVGVQSVLWTDRVNVRVTYPGTTPSIKYSFQDSAAKLECLPFASSGLQQALLFSKRVFTPTVAAPIFLTFAVKMSSSSSPDSKKQWGWFDGGSGYFFQIKADGSGDNFSIVRRSNFGGIAEQEIVRSQFNGDRLINLSFSNITMYGIEVAVGCGYNARFWAFIDGKWVIVHTINSGAGTLQIPSINEKSLPLAFTILNTSITSDTQTFFRYGCSVSSLGEIADDNIPNEVSVTKNITAVPGSTYVLMGIRGQQVVNGIQNSNTLLPLSLKVYSGNNLVTLFLLKNPEIDSSLIWSPVGSSGVETNIVRLTPFNQGNRIVTISIPSSSGATINLNNLFSLQREFGSNRYANDIQLPTDTQYQPLIQQDSYWLCATYIGFKPTLVENFIPWDTSAVINTTITNNGSIDPYIKYAQSTTFNITTSLSFLEV